jgi:hypothetical protein
VSRRPSAAQIDTKRWRSLEQGLAEGEEVREGLVRDRVRFGFGYRSVLVASSCIVGRVSCAARNCVIVDRFYRGLSVCSPHRCTSEASSLTRTISGHGRR